MEESHTYVLESASGLTFAFVLFLGICGVIAVGFFTLLTHPSARRPAYLGPPMNKPAAAFIAVIVFIVTFGMVFLGSFAGFQRISVKGDRVVLDYVIPNLSVTLPYDHIGDVIRRPAFRSYWRLEIYTDTGAEFHSVPGWYRDIKAATDDVEARRMHKR